MIAAVKDFSEEDRQKFIEDCKSVINHSGSKRIYFDKESYKPLLKMLKISPKNYNQYTKTYSEIFNKAGMAKHFLMHLTEDKIELPIMKYVLIERQFLMDIQTCDIADSQISI